MRGPHHICVFNSISVYLNIPRRKLTDILFINGYPKDLLRGMLWTGVKFTALRKLKEQHVAEMRQSVRKAHLRKIS